VPFEELIEFLGLSKYRNLEAKVLSDRKENKPEDEIVS